MSGERDWGNTLGVYLGERRVGILNRLAGDRHIFAFEQDYVDDPSRPTLSLCYKGESGGVVTAVRPVGRRLPPFFSNLLPEGHLRNYLADKAGVKPEREFSLMAALGEDVAGAVRVKPMGRGEDGSAYGAEEERTGGGGRTGTFHFSLAGVQLKFSAIVESKGGLTIPAHGVGGSWIVKLPSSQFQAIPENEYTMLALARAVGRPGRHRRTPAGHRKNGGPGTGREAIRPRAGGKADSHGGFRTSVWSVSG